MPKTLLFINLPIATLILLLYLMTFLLTRLICWPSFLYISESVYWIIILHTHTHTHTKKMGKCIKKRIRITSLVLIHAHSPTMGFLIVKVTQPCLTLCDPMDYTVHGFLQARLLEWVALPFSRGSF